MELSIEMARIFFIMLVFYAGPALLIQLGVVVILGLLSGRIEGWNRFDSVYWALITAFTVGYGDMRPTTKTTKVLSIIITLLGLVFAGMLVAVALGAAEQAFASIYGDNLSI